MAEITVEPLALWTHPDIGVQLVWFADGEYWQGTVGRNGDDYVVEDVHIVEED